MYKSIKNSIFASLLVLLMLQNEVQAETLFGRVVAVSDGDTLTVLDKNNEQHVIRLFGIDAPETSCHDKVNSDRYESCPERGQPFGKASKKYLSSLAFGQNVNVELQPGKTYDREIGTIWSANINVNLAMVKAGYAMMYRKYAAKGMLPEEYTEMEAAEKYADNLNLGMWSDGEPLPPWEYRRNGGGFKGK